MAQMMNHGQICITGQTTLPNKSRSFEIHNYIVNWLNGTILVMNLFNQFYLFKQNIPDYIRGLVFSIPQ